MHNLGGLMNRGAGGVFFIILGVILLIRAISQRKRANARGLSKEDIFKGIGPIVLGAGIIVYNAYFSLNPTIKQHEGYFIEHTSTKTIGTFRFEFSDDESLLSSKEFLMDSDTWDEIMDGTFEENRKYRIYYEENTNYIVGVEELSLKRDNYPLPAE